MRKDSAGIGVAYLDEPRVKKLTFSQISDFFIRAQSRARELKWLGDIISPAVDE